ncbi:two-component system chemotaxis response regulator CheB [Sphingobium wenxiniae]|uniref:protein-glutamate methylesterase n=1 Tax=Sphingobium wenxiniae (strain DSM 21828 / CGMCC 1.7748 / JZ-1) TaxID=595605 RepID=A0A562KG65_SPHWJ|nr:chemotaxis protein CheB [Sphingobium wenxiniae]MBB6190594.1 two-component system chemotaxis response regulator CheB [Sphingobium wenxiniae]TWH94372.1 two-component system chemotaxis response regulator CheB [Sphingobium wenxiniae]
MNAIVPILHSTRAAASAARVLVVDDSVVVRTVIERILNSDPAFRVVRKINNAEQALHYLAKSPVDLVLLDLELPGQSGLAALPAILQACPRVRVAILSGNCEAGSAVAVQALALGASDILSKPCSGSFGQQFPQALIERLKRLLHGDPPPPVPEAQSPPPPMDTASAHLPLACLGIGASTGGIHALGLLFGGLSAPLGVPILLTQHLPASFTFYFAQQLALMTSLKVRVAEQGDVLEPDTVFVAPGDANLRLRRNLRGRVCVHLTSERTPSGNLPGVDPMFSSIAETYGAAGAGVVLTGMGRDGTAGARDIVAAGGWVVAQDEASSVVWGMPGAVAAAGLSCAVLEPQAIMAFVARHGKARS